MLYREYKPSLPLQPYIFRYWTVQVDQASRQEKCTPDGSVKMFIYLGGNKPVYTDEKGNQKPWHDGVGGHPVPSNLWVQSPANTQVMGCTLKPAFFYRISGIPIAELNNLITDLDLVLGKEGLELKERMQQTPLEAARIQMLDHFLRSKLKQHEISRLRQVKTQVEHAQNLLLHHQGRIDVGKLSNLLNISERSLERQFLSHVGMRPKYYARVLRFNHAYRLKKLGNHLDWNDIAFTCGYYDQNHFIKEFKYFTGTPPTLFYSQQHQIKDVYLGK